MNLLIPELESAISGRILLPESNDSSDVSDLKHVMVIKVL